MKKIEKKVQENINKIGQQFTDCETIKKFEKANEEFEDLVNQGSVSKKRNKLLSPSDAHLISASGFNKKLPVFTR